jgi:hypothetical protein|tara:strand:+ start:1492 stop:1848 length:357 start_codon:yes stop_codon:yes gene_type:complete
MSKAHIFKKRDANRFRKIYSYIRRKPVDQFVSDNGFTMFTGDVDFVSTSGPVSLIYTTIDPLINFSNVPSITAISLDSLSNNSANVNIFITTITTTSVTFESSAPFTGKVNFQIVSQD